MKRSTYLVVGEILHRNNGKKYETVIGVDCEGCAFSHKHDFWCEPMKCSGDYRKDNTGVIFVRRKDLEKTQCSFDN
jgi:hypothetical protein